MTEDAVLFDTWPTRDERRIGVATLNAPRSLNALSLAMIEGLLARLEQWADDPSVAAVWLEGAGDKAFCAGGDVVALYRAMRDTAGARDADFATRYFSAEYRLDYRIHRYPKPLIVWGDGIILGGGLGLMAGGSERVVTETSRIAMPEITIGRTEPAAPRRSDRNPMAARLIRARSSGEWPSWAPQSRLARQVGASSTKPVPWSAAMLIWRR